MAPNMGASSATQLDKAKHGSAKRTAQTNEKRRTQYVEIDNAIQATKKGKKMATAANVQ
jgi:hypothetical protein